MSSLVAGVGYEEGRLTVSDNGRGIRASNPTGSGLKLIAALARQIGGQGGSGQFGSGYDHVAYFSGDDVTKR